MAKRLLTLASVLVVMQVHSSRRITLDRRGISASEASDSLCSEVVRGSVKRESFRLAERCKCRGVDEIVHCEAPSPASHVIIRKFNPTIYKGLNCRCDKMLVDVPFTPTTRTTVAKIVKPGALKGHTVVLAFYDKETKKQCVRHQYTSQDLGCYEKSQLAIMYKTSRVFTLEEEQRKCSRIEQVSLQKFIRLQAGKAEKNNSLLSKDWADQYSKDLYSLMSRIILKFYKKRGAHHVPIPKRMRQVDCFNVGSVVCPSVDDDAPNYWSFEKNVPQSIGSPAVVRTIVCVHAILRSARFDDDLNGTGSNEWPLALGNLRSKRDWVMSFYNKKTKDRNSMWPPSEVDLGSLFFKADEWNDGLEQAIAFRLIGAHRVELTSEVFEGESLPFVVHLNQFSELEVRPHFGKYGGDLYFNADGLPVMLETNDGRRVARGDKDWQYWKFVWRSSLIAVITMVDHLHLAHFRVANVLASASREFLSPETPLRRLMSLFTFGSIFVNFNAMHTLAGPQHVLHRGTPFKNFESVTNRAARSLPKLSSQHKAFMDDNEYMKLPQMLQDAPYFADGRLLFGAMRKMVKAFTNAYYSSICKDNSQFVDRLLTLEAVSAAEYDLLQESIQTDTGSCSALQDLLSVAFWSVTGWHRHVGTIGDLLDDPTLASFSWKEGEASGLPRQHFISSALVAYTGTSQPKINEDYSHIFKGIEKEDEAVKIMLQFRTDLKEVKAEIDLRNRKRKDTWGYGNFRADPNVVEISVAV